jgi:hypothetical protein
MDKCLIEFTVTEIQPVTWGESGAHIARRAIARKLLHPSG